MIELWQQEEMAPHIEAFRKELAKTFGITVIDNRITLRAIIDGKHTEMSAIITIVHVEGETCDSCGTPFTQDMSRNKSKASFEQCVGKCTYEMTLCDDCYCPK